MCVIQAYIGGAAGGPTAALAAEDAPIVDACILVFTVSKGYSTKRPAMPPTVPATISRKESSTADHPGLSCVTLGRGRRLADADGADDEEAVDILRHTSSALSLDTEHDNKQI